MTEPDDHEHVNLHPGQYDEGGTGGMATRELQARHRDDDEPDDDEPDGEEPGEED